MKINNEYCTNHHRNSILKLGTPVQRKKLLFSRLDILCYFCYNLSCQPTLTRKISMKIQKVSYVNLSDLFHDCDDAIEQFNCSDFDVSFGDASHTLVNKDTFIKMMEDAGLDEAEINPEQTPLDFDLKTIYNRFHNLKDNILIDLES